MVGMGERPEHPTIRSSSSGAASCSIVEEEGRVAPAAGAGY